MGRAPLFAAAYFLVSLLPVLGFADMSFMENSLVADHLQYVAMIGVIALAAGVLARLTESKGAAAPMGALAAAGCVLVLGGLTWTRAGLYGDARSMWRDNVATNPSAWPAWNNLGWISHSAGDDEEAVRDFSRAILLKPDYAMALNNRGAVYAMQGKLDLALADCNKAVALLPNVARVRITRGSVFFETHRFSAAIADYSAAIRLSPSFAEAYSNRARVWLELKDYDRAWADVKTFRSLGGAPDPDFVPALIEASGRDESELKAWKFAEAEKGFREALFRNPTSAEAHKNLGDVYSAEGRLEEALRCYDHAIALKPNFAEAYVNRGNVHVEAKRYAEAIRDYGQAIALKPDLAAAYAKRAQAFYQIRKYSEARRDLDRCMQLGGKPDPTFLKKLKEANEAGERSE